MSRHDGARYRLEEGISPLRDGLKVFSVMSVAMMRLGLHSEVWRWIGCAMG
ncbi:hypothetical protein [Acetobacter papayae]|uniref:hypothetical protein n=1 Tax=Acetobacter papayae TaxID=1076592 RepID=UPI000AF684D3|nr:hypothetical protein [Acetobacter papayae]